MIPASYLECETNAATGSWVWPARDSDENENARVKTSAMTFAVLLGLCNPAASYGTTFRFEEENYGATEVKQEAYYWDRLTHSDGTTTPPELAGASVVKKVLSQISGDLTEDIESRRRLRNLIQKYGEPTIGAIEEWTKMNSRKQTLIAEVMRLLGEVEDSASKSARLELLGKGLKSGSPVIRDSSALGLEDMGDIRAIRLLESAIDNEPYESLRQDYKMIVDSLRA